MDLNRLAGIPSIRDQDATLWVLTGPNWAWFVQQLLRHAEHSILLSLYLLSPHWQRHRPGTTNLLAELGNAGQRLTAQGLPCRAVLGSPGQNRHTASYNQEAAAYLVTTGWNMRLMRSAVTLHEKIMIVDNEICVIGSHNVSQSSATSNLDTSIGIHSKIVAAALKASWWSRWNQAEAYRGIRQDNEPDHKSERAGRPAGRVHRAGSAARPRIL